MKGVYIFLANGFEEIEALATLDVLRRGGVDVKTVSVLYDKFVTGSHKTTVVADMTYGEFKAEVQLDGTDESDVMIFPGGMPGTRNLAENGEIINFMRLHYAEGVPWQRFVLRQASWFHSFQAFRASILLVLTDSRMLLLPVEVSMRRNRLSVTAISLQAGELAAPWNSAWPSLLISRVKRLPLQ